MKILTKRSYENLVDTLLEARTLVMEGDALCRKQQQMLEEGVRYAAQLEQANLENLRTIQHLAGVCLLVRANPEADIETDLDAILREVSDKVALIEEHIS